MDFFHNIRDISREDLQKMPNARDRFYSMFPVNHKSDVSLESPDHTPYSLDPMENGEIERETVIEGVHGLGWAPQVNGSLISALQLYSHNIQADTPVPLEIEQQVDEFMKNQQHIFQDMIDENPLHFRYFYLKSQYEWCSEHMSKAEVYKMTGAPDKPGNMTLTVYNKLGSAYIEFHPRYWLATFCFITVFNFRLVIQHNPLEAKWITEIVAHFKENLALLDKECPIFWKYYMWLKVNRQDMELTLEQRDQIANQLENCWQTVKKEALASSLIPFRHIVKFMGQYCGWAEDVSVEWKQHPEKKFQLTFTFPNAGPAVLEYPSKWFELCRYLILILRTRLYLKVCDSYDGSKSLEEIWGIIFRGFQDPI